MVSESAAATDTEEEAAGVTEEADTEESETIQTEIISYTDEEENYIDF